MNKVKEFREECELTQVELAVKAGCTEQTVYNIERGGNTTISLGKRLARILKSTLDDLFPDDEANPINNTTSAQ